MISLVVQIHLEHFGLPIPIHYNKILTRLQVEIESVNSLVFVFTFYPSIAIRTIFHHYHESSPDIVIAVVMIVLFIFLYQIQYTICISLFYSKLSKWNSSFSLFDYTSQRIVAIIYSVYFGFFKFFLYVIYLKN